MYCIVFNVWPKTTLLFPVWPRDAKSLDTPVDVYVSLVIDYILGIFKNRYSLPDLCSLTLLTV